MVCAGMEADQVKNKNKKRRGAQEFYKNLTVIPLRQQNFP
jgi:hypothetical protein